MDDQNNSFNQWQFLGENSIEEDRESRHRNGEESALPILRDIVSIIESDQALDIGTRDIGSLYLIKRQS